jgi:hypothetical protein
LEKAGAINNNAKTASFIGVTPSKSNTADRDFGYAIAAMNFVDTAECRNLAVPPMEYERRMGI